MLKRLLKLFIFFTGFVFFIHLLIFQQLQLPLAQSSNQDLETNNCGFQNRFDFVLQRSIYCYYQNAIYINNSNIELNLNKSSITGSGYLYPHYGVIISDKENITIKGPGKIAHFQVGILIENSKKINISSINLTGNEISVLIKNSSEIYLDKNQLYTNTAGIKGKFLDNSIISNSYFDSNDLYSVAIFSSYQNKIYKNNISSSLNSVFMDKYSFHNSVDSNHFLKSSGSDINYGNGAKVNKLDNFISNNTCFLSIPDGLCN